MPSARLIAVWGVVSIAGFLYANYLVQRVHAIALPPLVAAHHFLIYENAWEMVLFGCGVAAAARLAAARIGVSPAPVLILSLAAILAWSYPSFLGRDDYGIASYSARVQFPSVELRRVGDWIRANTESSDVFLTADAACLSLVAPAGRKCVALYEQFSNP